MDLLDAHHHLWDVSKRDYPWMDGPWADPLRGRFDVNALAPLAHAAQVTATIVVQAVSDVEETQQLLAVARQSRLVAGVVGWVNLAAADVADALARLCVGPGLVGIRHQVQDEPDSRWLLRHDVLAGLHAVAEAGLVYDLLVTPRELDAAIEAARRLPQLRFVLDHLGKPEIGAGTWQPWADQLTTLAALPNVTAKISGLVTEAGPQWTREKIEPYLRHAVDTFTPRRLMWGSDWPVCTLAATYLEVVDLTSSLFDEADKAEIFGGTARRVYLGGR